jgi:hypothetical protein
VIEKEVRDYQKEALKNGYARSWGKCEIGMIHFVRAIGLDVSRLQDIRKQEAET